MRDGEGFSTTSAQSEKKWQNEMEAMQKELARAKTERDAEKERNRCTACVHA